MEFTYPIGDANRIAGWFYGTGKFRKLRLHVDQPLSLVRKSQIEISFRV
jgi:hypothetical protein